MVRIKLSQKVFTEDEVCVLTGICLDHLRGIAKNKHATHHFHETGHPIIQSLEPGEDWNWCYVDQMMVKVPESKT